MDALPCLCLRSLSLSLISAQRCPFSLSLCFCNIQQARHCIAYLHPPKSGLTEASLRVRTSKGQPVDILCISHFTLTASLGSLPLILRLIVVSELSLLTAVCKSGFAN
ncbi:hypothetical protein J3F84DRAFT_225173 [Trichoderma pleuroticola]